MLLRFRPVYNTLPRLSGVGDVAKYSGFSPSQIQKLYPYMFLLKAPVLPRNENEPKQPFIRRFPSEYTSNLLDAIYSVRAKVRKQAAIDFSYTELAQDAIQSAQRSLEATADQHTSSEGLMAASGVAKVLAIGRPTVTDWAHREAVPIINQDNRLYISRSVFDQMCEWQYPQVQIDG